MRAFRFLFAVTALAFACASSGQDSQRGSIPPGQSQDGAAPSGGALKGGAIVPGETAGLPDNRSEQAKIEQRCRELSGTLREDCLREARDPAAGASGAPSDTRRPKAERAD